MRCTSTLLLVVVVVGCGRRNFNVDAGNGEQDGPGACVAPAAPECSDPVAFTCGSSCMFTCSNDVQNSRAEVICGGLGARVATIQDQIESDCVAFRASPELWIGLEQDDAALSPELGWNWRDQTSFSFNAWAAGQPDDAGGVENGEEQCARLDLNGGWSDTRCDLPKKFVCERIP